VSERDEAGLAGAVPRLLERDLRIAADGQSLARPAKAVIEAPGARASRGDVEIQPLAVCELVGLLGSLGGPDLGVREHRASLTVFRGGRPDTVNDTVTGGWVQWDASALHGTTFHRG